MQALTEGDLDRSLLLARQGVALDDSPITRGNLLAALLRSPAAIGGRAWRRGPRRRAIDLAPDGRTLVVGGSHGGVEFFDAVTRRRIGLPATVGTSIVSLRFSPDGTRVAVAGYDRFGDPRIELLDAHSRRSLGDLDLSFVDSYLGDLGGLAFSPDSRALVADYRVFPLVSRERRYLGRWDARTGRPLGPPRRDHIDVPTRGPPSGGSSPAARDS